MTDESAAKTEGDWGSGTLSPVFGLGYLHDGNRGKGQKMVTFEIEVPKPGDYQVKLLYVANKNRSSKTPVQVSVSGVSKEMVVDQCGRQKFPPIVKNFPSRKSTRQKESSQIYP